MSVKRDPTLAAIVARLERGRPALGCAALLIVAASCGGEPRKVTFEVTPGHEADAFHEPPAVTRMALEARDETGAVLAAATGAPGGTVSFGELESAAFVALDVTGVDEAAVTRVRGRSVGVPLGALATDVLPVFAQRLGAFARPPGSLSASHVRGHAVAVGERFLLLTGGSATHRDGTALEARTATVYDLLALGPALAAPLPRAAEALVVVPEGDAVLVVGSDGATFVDLQTGAVTEAELPLGLASFASVAGGATVVGPSASYVVGPTRTTGASDRVLVLGEGRALSAVALAVPRAGAAAAWLDGVGLVVAGGSASAAGVETLAVDATAFVPRPYPSDPTEGAAAVATGDEDGLLLVGGTLGALPAPTRALAAGCATTCAAAVVAEAGLSVPLFACRGFTAGAAGAIVVCEDADGNTRAYESEPGGAASRELALREPRAGAAVVPTPLGTLALLGGAHPDGTPALTIESYFPSD